MMTTRLRVRLAMPCLMIVMAGCGQNPPIADDPLPESYELPRKILREEAAGRALGKATRSSAADLERALQAAKTAGLPLDRTIPVVAIPESSNAASEYRRLGALLKEDPLSEKEVKLINGANSGRLRDEGATNQMERLLDGRSEAIQLIHAALEKPSCSFNRDWSKGSETPFPEYSTIRSAARLTSLESVYLAQTGKSLEGMQRLQQAFRLVTHVTAEKNTISYLVGAAVRAILVASAQTILRRSGERDPAVLLAAKELPSRFPADDLRGWYEGEFRMWRIEMERWRREGPVVLEEGAESSLDPENPAPHRKLPPPPKYTPEEQAAWRRYCDAMEADTVRVYVELLQTLTKTRLLRAAAIVKSVDSTKKTPDNPVTAYRHNVLPTFMEAEAALVRSRFKLQIVAAGANLLLHRRKAGRFPDRLNEALSPVPVDPFTGRPLSYRREGHGFVLDSPGTDAGDPEPSKKSVVFSYPLPQAQ